MHRYLQAGLCALFFLATLAVTCPAPCEEDAAKPDAAQNMQLVKAVICEKISGYAPVNSAVVFPISLGQVSCFTAFEQIPATLHIFHSWFRRDDLISTKRLVLQPPRWSTVSSIQLRQADKGPWRVEIHDQWGKILATLRFSITD